MRKNHLKLRGSYRQWRFDWKNVLTAGRKSASKSSISVIHNVLIDFMLFVVRVTRVTDCNDVSHNKCHLALSNAQQVCTEVNSLQKSITVRASVDRSANTGCPVFAVDKRHFLLPKYARRRRQWSALWRRSRPVIKQATGPQRRSTILQLDDASSTSLYRL